MAARDQWHTSGLVWGALIVSGVASLMIGLHRGEASFVKYMELSEDREKLEEAISRMQVDISRTEREIERIRSSSDYAKKVLQEKYNILEPGERVILVPDSEVASTAE
jgi:cell division protein FtsB